jgi:Protein of unknown function (DUF2380)
MSPEFWSYFRLRLASVLGAVAVAGVVGFAQTGDAEIKYPIKLAVFEFELDDFSAGGPIAGESAAETARLQAVTLLAQRQLANSHIFEIVDVDRADDQMVKTHWLRNCNGCDAAIARKLGADMSLVGIFRKVSIMEQYLEIRIRDANTGELMKVAGTDYRGETDESWNRALTWLIQHRIVEPELAHMPGTSAK